MLPAALFMEGFLRECALSQTGALRVRRVLRRVNVAHAGARERAPVARSTS
jgi:hypothetical protein